MDKKRWRRSDQRIRKDMKKIIQLTLIVRLSYDESIIENCLKALTAADFTTISTPCMHWENWEWVSEERWLYKHRPSRGEIYLHNLDY